MSKTGTESQLSGKQCGTCPRCNLVRQLKNNGRIFDHGPRTNRCPGSGEIPLVITHAAPFPPSAPSPPGQLPPATPPPSSTTTSHPPHWKHSIRHIPKPARSACARSLCDRLEAVVSRPDNPNNWREVLDFGCEILHCQFYAAVRDATSRRRF